MNSIARWNAKKVIEEIDSIQGTSTSMLTLVLRPNEQIHTIVQKLVAEQGAATNIKKAINRNSVIRALSSAIAKLKTIMIVPPNGLVVFVGTGMNPEGKTKKINLCIEPVKPVKNKLYYCNSTFYTKVLKDSLVVEDTFGFIVIDGHGCLFGTLTGDQRQIVHQFKVDLPNKHRRGGQSALRFARLRLEKRNIFVRKVTELATQLFIENNKCTCKNIIVAGLANLKYQLVKDETFDPRLKEKVIDVVDVSYGGHNGFEQAISKSEAHFENLRYNEEKKILEIFFGLIVQDTGTYCYGVQETIQALASENIKELIIWDNLKIERCEVVNRSTQETEYFYLTPAQLQDPNRFINKQTGHLYELKDKKDLVKWIIDTYSNSSSCTIEIISDATKEGAQFSQGFGGIGGLLHYKLDHQEDICLNDFESELYSDYEEYM